MLNFSIRQAINPYPLTTTPDTSVSEAIARMNQAGTSCVLVVEQIETNCSELVGLFTERDVVRLTASGVDLAGCSMQAVMTRQIITLKDSEVQDLFAVLALFRQHRIRHLPIVDDKGQLVGLITQSSILQAIDQNQRALRESEVRFRSLFEQAAVGVAQVRSNGEWFLTNQKLCDILGYTKEELLGHRFQEITHPEDLPATEEYMRSLLAGEIETFSLETRYIRRDGSIIWVNMTASMGSEGKSGDSHPVAEPYLIIVFQDITDRKQAEAALQQLNQELETRVEERRSELRQAHEQLSWETQRRWQLWQQYCRVVDNLKEVVFQTDELGNWTFLNPAWREITGFSIDESLNQQLLDYIHCDDAHFNQEQCQLLVEGKKDYCRHQSRFLTKDGKVRWIEIFAQPMLDEEGNLIGIAGTLNDVTEQKQAQMALQASEARFRSLFEQAAVGVAQVGLNGEWLLVNQKLCHILGYTHEELLGHRCQEIIYPKDWPATQEYRRSLLAGEIETYSLQERYIRSDSSVVWVNVTKSLMRSEEGEPQYFIKVVEDISDRKQAEENLQYRIELEQIIANISTHFINMDTDEIDSGITAALQQIGEFAGVDRSYVFGLSDDGISMSNIHEWCAMGIEPQINNLQEMPLESFRWFLEKIQRFEVVHIPRVTELPPEANNEKECLLMQSIQSLINVPMAHRSQLLGFVGFDSVRTAKTWTEESITLLRLVGEIFANALQRKQANSALLHSEERFRQLAENIESVFWMTDTHKKQMIYVSPAYETIWGRTCTSLYTQPKSFLDTIHPEDRSRVIAALAKQVRGDYDEEYRIVQPDGEIRWIRDRAFPIENEAGEVYRVTGIAEDITERKKAELTQRVCEARYRTVVEDQTELISRFLPDGTLTFVNSAYCRYFGASQEELIGHSFLKLLPEAEQEMGREMQEELASLTLENPVLTREQEVVKLDGSSSWQQWTHRAIFDENGQLLEFQAVGRDITPRVCAEKALQQAKEAAEAANRTKSQFLANMSHELRTPLNAVLGFAQLMVREQELNQQAKEYLDIISRGGEHLLELINDVLEMSKIEAGKTSLNPSSFDLHHLLDSLEEMLRLKAESKGLQLIFDRAREVPQYMQGDESKLRQVLINLLGNAVKFTEAGTVILRMRVRKSEVRSHKSEKNLSVGDENPATRKATDNPLLDFRIQNSELRLFFEVQDTGPGISPNELESLFEPFVQTKSGQSVQEGTGLGLPISREFVRLMGGELTVSSVLGMGATFKFDVPLTLAEPSSVPVQQPSRQVIGLEPDQPQYRILVVEDKWTNRQLLVKLLEKIGFEVREAENGREAIALWSSWEPHLIWMDMRMPVMDGYEATKHIKATSSGQATTIIALTASAFEEERADILAAGCDDFVRKPFQEEVILEKMAEHLGVRYIYKEPVLKQDNRRGISEETPTTANLDFHLSQMPAEWVAQLEGAALKGFDRHVFQLIEQIPSTHAPLANALADWANNFRFDKVINLIQQAAK
ncbi:MAG: PAS domain S-box protein [Xenococcaceae cyanobacterium]